MRSFAQMTQLAPGLTDVLRSFPSVWIVCSWMSVYGNGAQSRGEWQPVRDSLRALCKDPRGSFPRRTLGMTELNNISWTFWWCRCWKCSSNQGQLSPKLRSITEPSSFWQRKEISSCVSCVALPQASINLEDTLRFQDLFYYSNIVII